ncbi:MAG: orotidine-5'-phosphate decarboxylase [Bdellovibrio sp.]
MVNLSGSVSSKPEGSPLTNPLILALDVDDESRARQLAGDLQNLVGAFKLGPRLILRTGGRLIRDLAQNLPVFVDLKFFDIPSTMLSAVRSCFELGASLVTVHSLAGKETLVQLARLEAELVRQRPFKILAVTILTSFEQESLASVFKTQSLQRHVVDLVDLAQSAGLSGIVCSPEELKTLSNRGLFLVTPGIRLPENDRGDQKRVLSPEQALAEGASAIVVGRPILEASNPAEAALRFTRSLGSIRP